MASNAKLKGWHYAFLCYFTWGTFPIYWYPLNQSAMPAEQILAQRIVWSAVFALLLLVIFRQGRTVLNAFRKPRIIGIFSLTAFLIALNWLIYLWAITNHHVLDASLGYFINPLFNVFLGWLVFKERLNKAQLTALCLTIAGILWLAIPAGQIPWVALSLAGSFSLYALIRKLAPMEPLAGLTLETLLLFPFALAYLIFCAAQGNLVFGDLTGLQLAVLLGSGIATTIPLLWFAIGARQISMSLLGMLQYISPSLQFLCGWLVLGEQLSMGRLIGYTFVWASVIIFLTAMRQKAKQSK
ncbi:chloramphenicol-sensitive protein RarD [Pasteurella langaaensis DSM 22999]|uniref:Chloramphenicol-sensitive protein RarD n=1 Tax=Alitibacter langaaensis DSM 22999 TaxID=1122935 RepID=A0A2U0T6L1_9PAST|nr:EamA family transporter RarD [Pasteurella langaaensis]PVX39229.1 chloramphenicol-sensitive protein RarD [Pasteurella langaaensis DSM 22999]